jgi:hypothetical protein
LYLGFPLRLVFPGCVFFVMVDTRWINVDLPLMIVASLCLTTGWRHDTQHNGSQKNDIQRKGLHCYTEHTFLLQINYTNFCSVVCVKERECVCMRERVFEYVCVAFLSLLGIVDIGHLLMPVVLT